MFFEFMKAYFVAEGSGDEAGKVGNFAVVGRSDSGKVARCVAAGSVGKYKAPCWPQAARPAPKTGARATALATRATRRPKIGVLNNILKL
jgi:hypothetical protein